MARGEVATAGPPCLTPDTMNDSISSSQSAEIRAQLQRERARAVENRPTREEAMSAVRVLLRWAGDDPDREGLVGTPDRVTRAYDEFFAGYQENPVEILSRTFEETEGYDELVVLKDIRFESHCEHHMVPIIGKAHIAYLPDRRVGGHQQAGAGVGGVCEALPDPREDDGAGRHYDPVGVAASGGSGGRRRLPSMHDHARGPSTRRLHGDVEHARRVPRQPRDAPRILDTHRQVAPARCASRRRTAWPLAYGGRDVAFAWMS